MTKRKKARQQTKSKAFGAALATCRAAIWAYYRRIDVYACEVDQLLACIVLTAPGRSPVEPLQAATKARGGAA